MTVPDVLLCSIHVVAGVIRDVRGRILLARRTDGRDLAGLWEFPGGKVEPGELPEAALIRELGEELGIDAVVGEPLIEVPQQYPEKRLRLDVRHIRSWSGRVRGREGQALAWVPLAQLPRYDMPPADRPVVAALLQPDRVLVTPDPIDPQAWLHALQRALDAGARRVNLRVTDGTRDSGDWPALATRAIDLCSARGVDVRIHGDAALASRAGAGLHLQAAQLAAFDRSTHPSGLGLSASCHTLDDLRHAERLECDFAFLGSVQPTTSHPGGPTLGWPGFAALREHVALPLYAIGGLSPGDVSIARTHGGQGIAAIRSLWSGS